MCAWRFVVATCSLSALAAGPLAGEEKKPPAAPAAASGTAFLRQMLDPARTLAGHAAVRVRAAAVPPPGLKRMSLRSQTLQDYAIRRLKAADVPVSEKAPTLFLLVHVGVARTDRGYMVYVCAEALQAVRLVHSGNSAFVATWRSELSWPAALDEVDGVAKQFVDIELDDFVTDWKKAHAPGPDPFKDPPRPEAAPKAAAEGSKRPPEAPGVHSRR